jgi:DNA-binding NtrC family response regulator
MEKKIMLFVDDEKIILDSLKSQLKGHFGNSFLYETAENAQEAIEVIDELMGTGTKTIVIILSDWLMPGIKGDEFLIKVHKKYPNIVKIMLTGQADAKAIERSKREANLYKCIAKPWIENDLIDTISGGLKLQN